MIQHVVTEAKRCLKCKNPKCQKGCPVDTPIKDIIELFLDKDINPAGEMLFRNNPLSVVCSLVCPHEYQCEGHCVLGNKGYPIKFSSIEHYISDYYLNLVKPDDVERNGHRVAIIGAGPAGITLSFMLSAMGYDITLFEANDKIGGVLRYGIPEFRLPKEILERLKDKLIENGVKIRPNTLVGPLITIDDLFADDYKAIFIGTGVWNPKKVGIKGETLGHVHYAIDYLKNPDVYDLGRRVVVIGSGNAAMDVARTALRKGAREVTIMYRKGYQHMSARQHEVNYAKIDGVQFELFKQPLAFTDEGVRYIEMEEISDNDGNTLFSEVDGSEGIFETDAIIVSVSQGPRANIVSNAEGIKVDRYGLVITDTAGRTTREGVFASGDVVTGANTVVDAVKYSKLAAEAIDGYIKEKY